MEKQGHKFMGQFVWTKACYFLALGVLILSMALMNGCTVVTTYRYVHEPTEKIRTGFFESQYFKKASDALPSDHKGVQLVPDFSHKIGPRANLHGYFNIVARSNHSVKIETIAINDQATSQSYLIQVRESIRLKHIKQTNLWYGKIQVEIPSNRFKNVPVLSLNVEWKENTPDSKTTAFTLNGVIQRSIAFSR